MTCMVQRLPPAFVARTVAEARAILADPESGESLKRMAWRFLLDERRRDVQPPCDTEGQIA